MRTNTDLQQAVRYERLLDVAPCGLLLVDSTGQVVDINETLCKCLGYKPKEPVGRTLSELFDVPLETLKGHLRNVIVGNDNNTNVTFNRFDGSLVRLAIHSTAFDLPDGSPGVLSSCHERPKAQSLAQEAHISDARLARVLEATGVAIADWDVVGGSLRLSGPLPETWKSSPARAKDFLSLVYRKDQSILLKAIREHLNGVTPTISVEFRIKDREGLLQWHELTAMCSEIDADYDSKTLSGTIRNIDFQRTARQQMQDMQKEMCHLSRVATIGELSGGIAHEVSQPLYAIANYATAAVNRHKHDEQSESESLSTLTKIQTEAFRGGEIVKSLLRFARKQPLQRTNESLCGIVEEACLLLREFFNRENVSLKVVMGPEVRLLVDRVQVQQILVNLFQNAKDAIAESDPSHGRIWVGWEVDQDNVTLKVNDNGPGIDSKPIEGIFRPFHTTRELGAGLGLAICRTIAETHGGTLTADNRAEGGATLCLRLPLP